MARMQPSIPLSANATFCATLVDEWILGGVTTAFIAPGSRSTPLALALTARDDLAVHVFHDERSAAFCALGSALATGIPAVAICSSGTAGAHFYAAVIEADTSCVPMLVCTADRPPELWNTGAPQTIDQTELYGNAVRAFHQPGPPDDPDVDRSSWRKLARLSVQESLGLSPSAGQSVARPGPVHLNLSFRDPLVGLPGPLPALLPLPDTQPPGAEPRGGEQAQRHLRLAKDARFLADLVLDESGAPRRGAIVAGRGQSNPEAVQALAQVLGWPILADHRSGCRAGNAIRHFDALLRDADFAASHRPDVLLRLGEIVASKSTSQWIASLECESVAVTPWGREIDPEAIDPTFLAETGLDEPGLIEAVLELLPDSLMRPDAPWVQPWSISWTNSDKAANIAITALLSSQDTLCEPTVARAALAEVPTGGALVISASMPIRDVEWLAENRADIDVYANRGANGIDGVTSTAIGVALTGAATTCLIGDVAFLHDTTAMIALTQRDIDLTIIVTDNDGGGIFSFLPQHTLLSNERYEQLFGTPHSTDLAGLARAHGITVLDWANRHLVNHGVRVVLAKTDRASNLELHDRIVEVVANSIVD